MPKLKNVTAADLAALADSAMELMGQIQDTLKRIEAGYADPISEPCQLASSFHALSRTTSDLTALLIANAGLNELRAQYAATAPKNPQGE